MMRRQHRKAVSATQTQIDFVVLDEPPPIEAWQACEEALFAVMMRRLLKEFEEEK